MHEGLVNDILRAHLQANGYTIEREQESTRHGADILAVRRSSGRFLLVAAKGSPRMGEPRQTISRFRSNLVFDRVLDGVCTAMKLRAKYEARRYDVAIAFPDYREVRARVAPLSLGLRSVGIRILLASDDSSVAELYGLFRVHSRKEAGR